MGAETFDTFAAGESVDVAFREAVESAAWSYGHAGYTGTIAEKDGFVVICDDPMPFEEAVKFAWKLIDEGDERIDDKWGPAGAIRAVTDHGTRGWVFFGWASC